MAGRGGTEGAATARNYTAQLQYTSSWCEVCHLLLVPILPPDHLCQRVDRLGQNVGRNPARQQDGGKQGQNLELRAVT